LFFFERWRVFSYKVDLKFHGHARAAFADFLQVGLREETAHAEGNACVAYLVDDHTGPIAETGRKEFLGFEADRFTDFGGSGEA
jgi:hypothetical protein